MIFRDDDVSKETNLKRFKQIHELFNKYKTIHTVSLICEGIESNKPLLKYLKSQKNIDVQIHAWTHFDFTSDIKRLYDELPQAIKIIETHFKKPHTLYPPWNQSNIFVEKAAMTFGLKVSNKKISLSQYLKGVRGEVINFHYWSEECNDLEAALKKYTA